MGLVGSNPTPSARTLEARCPGRSTALRLTNQDVVDPAAAELFYKGTVDGEELRGIIDIPAFPSMSTTLELTLLGRRWEVQLESQYVMTLTDHSGRVMTFRKV